MAREPGQGDAYVFDLVEGDADDAGVASAGSGAPPEPAADTAAPPPEPPLRDRYLRVVGPVAAVLAVALGTGVAVESTREAARYERVRELRGGVADLTDPLEELWAWEGRVGPQQSFAFQDSLVAVLGDWLVLPSGDRLVALDPASGDEAWSVDLGTDPVCGPLGLPGRADVEVRRLVCVAGSPGERTLRVVEPDGSISAERALDPADDDRYGAPRPGPGGTLLRAERVGPLAEVDLTEVRCTVDAGCTGSVTAGRGVVVRAEDAATGEERWTVDVPFRRTPVDRCSGWFEEPWGRERSASENGLVETETFDAAVSDRLITLYGCGVEVGITPSGLLLGAGEGPGRWWAEELRLGEGYVVHRATGTTTLHDATGAQVAEADAPVLTEPLTADGTGPVTLLATQDGAVAAFAPDGTPRWTVPGESAQTFVAQVRGTVVLHAMDGSLLGLDLETGEPVWRQPGNGIGYVTGAFTDGRAVLLVAPMGEGFSLRAYDAASGDVLWEGDAPPSPSDVDDLTAPLFQLVAVDGRLLDVTSDGVRALG
ncbi:PQQ-binding-like beta-propeller repeat protein [Promicromonospora citrea]|uniref:Pyrrolo-quinoline quinone repeat domain-containing protein n=1 Tax=Promicromonospora citrea TaxID=43677 RepID=A0A8H9GD12_9MICO|nr:PQQ-binding-like beta-propeller repeat protein [Promicromonospora citrea]NNH53670.1 PQQ-binding-like beta-propeller repeat protein [Promicromonospora citrea]GGM10649.1 hypothetical protein GCM10010102_03160 [Promicromonospora citrea]